MKTSVQKLLFFFSLSVLLIACSKDDSDQDGQGNVNQAILGTWKFVASTGHSRQIVTAGTGANEEKIITEYGFISKNNAGTITIDASKFTTANVSYTIDTTVHTQLYLGGVMFDEFETDWLFDAPASSGSSAYKAVGTDSLYFTSGFITFDPSAGMGGGPVATQPSGSRISWSGDTLILKTTLVETKNQVINGVNAKVSNNIQQIVKLKK